MTAGPTQSRASVVPSTRHDCHAFSESVVLHGILAGDARRRRVWQRHVRRAPSDPAAISQAAVARALAAWLVEVGEADPRDRQLARRLKDPVSRALQGRVRLSPELKEAVVGAFDLDQETADRLWDPPSRCHGSAAPLVEVA